MRRGIEQALDFITRFGELLILAVIFRFAASRTASVPIELLSLLMFLALCVHVAKSADRLIDESFRREAAMSWPAFGAAVAGGIILFGALYLLVGKIDEAVGQLMGVAS